MQHFKDDTVVFSGRDIDVILSDEVSKKMNSFRQLGTASKESGGILIGERVIPPFLIDIKSRGYAAISGGLPPLALCGRL